MRILVVSPHRDDAALSLGLSLEHWQGAGHGVQVLNCFTRSDYAPFSDVESLHPNDQASFASAVRKREDEAWNRLLGQRVQFTDLDLLDAPLRLACGVDEVLTASIRPGDRAVARVAGAVAKAARQAAPGELAVVLPLAVGGHIDHRVVRAAGIEALAGVDLPVGFYEDLPYAALPESAGEVDSAAESTGMGLQPVFGAPPPSEPEAAVKRKRRMIDCYDSQIDSEAEDRILTLCAAYGGRERIWVNAAWTGSGLRSGAPKASA